MWEFIVNSFLCLGLELKFSAILWLIRPRSIQIIHYIVQELKVSFNNFNTTSAERRLIITDSYQRQNRDFDEKTSVIFVY